MQTVVLSAFKALLEIVESEDGETSQESVMVVVTVHRKGQQDRISLRASVWSEGPRQGLERPSQEALRDWESSGITGETSGVIGKGRAVDGRCV